MVLLAEDRESYSHGHKALVVDEVPDEYGYMLRMNKKNDRRDVDGTDWGNDCKRNKHE